MTLAGLALPNLLPSFSAAHESAASGRVDQAIANTFKDAGVRVITHVPATKTVDIFDTFHRQEDTTPVYSFNEEVAFTIAHRAAIAGSRSAAVIKSHSLAKAANSVVDSLTMGTTAGFVIVDVNDPHGAYSDNVFDLSDFL